MRIVLLGPVEAYSDDAALIDISGVRLRMLLTRLALEAGRPVSVDSLVDGLWAEDPPTDAGSALQALVSRLRKSLRGAGTVELVAGGYRLSVRPEDVDAHRFEELAAQGRRELAAGRVEQATSVLGQAMALWRGAALADVLEAQFARAAATRLEDLRTATAEDRSDAELRLGRHAEVLADLEAAGAVHPLSERLAALRMRALAAAGRQSDALAVYEEMRARLSDELGVDPSAELQEVHLALLRGQLERPSARRAPVRLPAPLTSFVGRQHELVRLAALLDTSRLVTLVGPGGAGKTRLALEAVTRHRAYERGRVWFVPLAGLGTADQLTDAVQTALGSHPDRGTGHAPGAGGEVGPGSEARGEVEPGTGGAGTEALRGGHSADRAAEVERVTEVERVADVERVTEVLDVGEAVLVLDNCEHLVDAAAALAEQLLDRLPHLRILATSREPLALTGETLCHLGPLEVPADTPELADAAGSPAVQLFIDRASAVRPDFSLDATTAGPVVEICRRLDGMPLALELAAAKLRSMSAEQIARRLDDRFRLLTSGSRTALPRQRTLLALVEWSWDLLDAPERVLARRLAVFPGGATLAALEGICSDESLPADDVVYVAGSLVEKSLVEVSDGAEPRYRMLETVRAYAATQLTRSGDDVSARFTDHFVRLAEEHEPILRTGEQLRAIALFDAEHDNLVFALRTTIEASDAATASRFVSAMFWYWGIRGMTTQFETYMTEVLKFGDALPAQTRAALSVVRLMSGSPVSEAVPTRALLTDLDSLGFHQVLPMWVTLLAYSSGNEDLGERCLHDALDSPDAWIRASAHLAHDSILTDQGDLRAGAPARLAALRGFESVGDRWGLGMALLAVGQDHSLRGSYGEAIAALERGAALSIELGTEDFLFHSRARLAGERMRSGDLDGARHDIQAAQRQARELGNRGLEAQTLFSLAELHRRSGNLAESDRILDRLEGVADRLPFPEEMSRDLIAAARLTNHLTRPHTTTPQPDAARPGAAPVDRPHSDGARSVRDGQGSADPVADEPVTDEPVTDEPVTDEPIADGAVRDGVGRELLAKAVRGLVGRGDSGSVAVAAELLAGVLELEGDPRGAAMALGMSQVIRGMFDDGSPELRELVASLVGQLGEESYRDAYQLGAKRSRPDALKLLTAERSSPMRSNG